MKSKKEKYDAWQLADNVMIEATIECTKCREGDNVMCDEDQALEYFFGEGWRCTPNHCYCPKCAKKYLKL